MYVATGVCTYMYASVNNIRLDVRMSFITGVPTTVPSVAVDNNTININGSNVTLTLSWGEPFNNFDPIVNYTVSCSGDVTCPSSSTTTDNTTRSYTITNLTPMTDYTFSVVATNSIGSGKAGVVMITISGTYKKLYASLTYVHTDMSLKGTRPIRSNIANM